MKLEKSRNRGERDSTWQSDLSSFKKLRFGQARKESRGCWNWFNRNFLFEEGLEITWLIEKQIMYTETCRAATFQGLMRSYWPWAWLTIHHIFSPHVLVVFHSLTDFLIWGIIPLTFSALCTYIQNCFIFLLRLLSMDGVVTSGTWLQFNVYTILWRKASI